MEQDIWCHDPPPTRSHCCKVRWVHYGGGGGLKKRRCLFFVCSHRCRFPGIIIPHTSWPKIVSHPQESSPNERRDADLPTPPGTCTLSSNLIKKVHQVTFEGSRAPGDEERLCRILKQLLTASLHLLTPSGGCDCFSNTP